MVSRALSRTYFCQSPIFFKTHGCQLKHIQNDTSQLRGVLWSQTNYTQMCETHLQGITDNIFFTHQATFLPVHRAFTCPHGVLPVHMGLYLSTWGFTCPHGVLPVHMGFYLSTWGYTCPHGLLPVHMGFYLST